MEEKTIIIVPISTQELRVAYMQSGTELSKKDMKEMLVSIVHNNLIDARHYRVMKDLFNKGIELLNNLETLTCDELATALNTYGCYNIKKLVVAPMEGE